MTIHPLLPDLTGPDLAISWAPLEALSGDPHPDEWEDIASAAPNRQKEFAAGRLLAHVLSDQLGLPPAPLRRADDRSPIWPADRTGSLSHCDTLCAAAVGKRSAFQSVGVDIETAEGAECHTVDEGIRFDATLEGIAGVKLLSPEGKITAASSSQICDGSSAVLVVSEQALKEYGLTPLARIHNLTVTAGDPVIMLEEPLFATDRALQRAGMSINDIDLYEVNEAFAPVPLPCSDVATKHREF